MPLSCDSGPDPGFSVGGVDPFWWGFGLQRGYFSVKMYAKTKELGPVGGACAGTPPRSTYVTGFHLLNNSDEFSQHKL